MESDLVDKLDEAWKRQGLHSRMNLFRKSLQAFPPNAGEADVAAMPAACPMQIVCSSGATYCIVS
jgi:hypothetical protein